MGQLDCVRAWSQELRGWEWSMDSHLSSLTEKETSDLGRARIRLGGGQRVASSHSSAYRVFQLRGRGKVRVVGGSRPRALPSRRAQASFSDLRRGANPASGAHRDRLSGPAASSGRPASRTPTSRPSLAGPRCGGGTYCGSDWAAPRRVPGSWESARRGEYLRGAGRRGLGPPLCATAPEPHALRSRVHEAGSPRPFPARH